MRPIFSETTLAVVREALVPSLRRRVPDDELSANLALLKRDGAHPLRKLANLYNVHHVTLRRWLKAAGKEPVCKGGDSGREEQFLLSDAQEVLAEKGVAPKMQEVL
jgi:hypothetical protein